MYICIHIRTIGLRVLVATPGSRRHASSAGALHLRQMRLCSRAYLQALGHPHIHHSNLAWSCMHCNCVFWSCLPVAAAVDCACRCKLQPLCQLLCASDQFTQCEQRLREGRGWCQLCLPGCQAASLMGWMSRSMTDGATPSMPSYIRPCQGATDFDHTGQPA